MKSLLLIAILSLSLSVKAQITGSGLSWPTAGVVWGSDRPLTKVVSKSDTTVLNKGDITCDHKFAQKVVKSSGISCAVMHDAAGCPLNWPNDFRICTACLRHENIKTSYRSEPIPDEYEAALKKLKQ